MHNPEIPLWWRDANQPASGRPGTVQTDARSRLEDVEFPGRRRRMPAALIEKAPAKLNRTEKYLELFAGFVGFFMSPLIMLASFASFGTLAAVQFRIFDITGDYGTGVITAFLLLASIYFWPIPLAHRKALALLWLVRIGVTLGIMLIFESIYGLDAAMYYRTGKALNDPFAIIQYGAGTYNIRAAVSMLSYVTDSYNSMKVMFAYVGLSAVYIFFRSASVCIGRESLSLLYIIGLIPSLIFWGSILGKDPIVLFGIAIYCYGAVNLFVKQKIYMITYVLIGLLLASYIRIWIALIFVTPLIITYVMAGRASIIIKVSFISLAIPGFLLSFQSFAENFNLETTRDLVTRTDQISGAWAIGGSAQQIQGGFDSIGSMISFLPVGSFTALFRPLPFEITNLFGTMAGLENGIILLLFVVGIFLRGFGWLRQPVLLWAATVLLVWSAIYGFASYQNLGTAFRFRAQVVPILLLLGMYLAFPHLAGTAATHEVRPRPETGS